VTARAGCRRSALTAAGAAKAEGWRVDGSGERGSQRGRLKVDRESRQWCTCSYECENDSSIEKHLKERTSKVRVRCRKQREEEEGKKHFEVGSFAKKWDFSLSKSFFLTSRKKQHV